MASQFRTIIGALDYSVHTLTGLKKSMQDLGGKKQKTAMAIGGVIVTMVSNLLVISQDVIELASKSDQPDAKQDIREIQKRFNEFLDKMIGE